MTYIETDPQGMMTYLAIAVLGGLIALVVAWLLLRNRDG